MAMGPNRKAGSRSGPSTAPEQPTGARRRWPRHTDRDAGLTGGPVARRQPERWGAGVRRPWHTGCKGPVQLRGRGLSEEGA